MINFEFESEGKMEKDCAPHVHGTKIELCPPWVEYYNKLECMFGDDPDIKLIMDDGRRSILMYVEDPVKAEAMMSLLPSELTFGGVEWTFDVIPGNPCKDRKHMIEAALKGNPHFLYAAEPADDSRPFTFFVFDKDVAQYYKDDLSDIYGYRSMLYAELAKEIFAKDEEDGIRFCTDL